MRSGIRFGISAVTAPSPKDEGAVTPKYLPKKRLSLLR